MRITLYQSFILLVFCQVLQNEEKLPDSIAPLVLNLPEFFKNDQSPLNTFNTLDLPLPVSPRTTIVKFWFSKLDISHHLELH